MSEEAPIGKMISANIPSPCYKKDMIVVNTSPVKNQKLLKKIIF